MLIHNETLLEIVKSSLDQAETLLIVASYKSEPVNTIYLRDDVVTNWIPTD